MKKANKLKTTQKDGTDSITQEEAVTKKKVDAEKTNLAY